MSDTLHAAVNYRDVEVVRRLAPLRTGMEARDELGATPLISAASSDQFTIAELLVQNGADIWAYTRFGVTAGQMIDLSLTPPSSSEGQARQRLKEAMARMGYPFPAPDRATVLELAGKGRWGPKGSGSAS